MTSHDVTISDITWLGSKHQLSNQPPLPHTTRRNHCATPLSFFNQWQHRTKPDPFHHSSLQKKNNGIILARKVQGRTYIGPHGWKSPIWSEGWTGRNSDSYTSTDMHVKDTTAGRAPEMPQYSGRGLEPDCRTCQHESRPERWPACSIAGTVKETAINTEQS